jgi:dihydrofolate reductase
MAMGRLIISANCTLDGVTQDPDGTEGHRNGGWLLDVGSADRESWLANALEETRAAAAILVGRHSYEFFADRWPARTGELAEEMNGTPKYVVTSTPIEHRWSNAQVLSTGIGSLKAGVDGDILVFGSRTLARSLLSNGYVDEVRLMLFPMVLSSGERLFPSDGPPLPMSLVGQATVGESLVLLTYRT